MPLYIDRHFNLAQYQMTVEQAAEAHMLDLKYQAQYGCNYLTYYFEPRGDTGFCLVEAPSAEAAEACHVAAHGEAASRIIEVTRETVEAFLGEIYCPGPGEPWGQSGFRAILCATLGSGDSLPVNGELRSAELAADYDRLVRQMVDDHGGSASRYLAGTFFASFRTCARAVECALALQRATSDGPDAVRALDVRCGVAAGEPVADTGDFFRVPMDDAGRIAAGCAPHGVGVSRVVADLCVGRYTFHQRGDAYEVSGATPVARPAHEPRPANFTAREVEVLRMIPRGLTNQEIATALVISPNTVARHISNILDKTGLANRTQAATYAATHGYD
jgi:DNA-binding CsgD family transcriptional regulator